MDMESRQGNKSPSGMTHPNHRSSSKKKRARNCCLICLAVLILVGLLFLILGLTVFKAKKPVITVNSVVLRDLGVSFDITKLQVHLNVTLQADLSVRNPNRVGFKYDSTSATLQYKGQVIGDAPVPAGKIGSRETRPMNITLTVMADRLFSNSGLYSDVMSGGLPLTTYVKLSGVVRVLFKIHVKSSTTCDLYIDVLNRKLVNQTCHYKTNL
ncbi:putative KH domain-containing protein-like [Capsicum annuum]|uniref:Late embryogenesis abundant protein LEA-2 subgroup domain-containing protein n=1 Tax=Capsicum annuum TaxID=4072 RepID=A0A2G3AMC1_CAPAN|nr:uncharacterized protein LOC107860415 [Capsicum annuum]KAF3620848.1 putative KH domain-containing protein-like [Capsicum annuum]KAF3680248.1 putative KH domain-containing protein-like [Capsicum annuum]PHT95303.1 hypothetical protein T459_03185 [Capsicum annuum]